MEKIIEIDLNDKYDLIDKYNEKNISAELADYIIKQVMSIKKNNKVKIIINKKCNINIDSTKLVKDGLKEEYNRSLKEHHKNNIKQLFLLLLGIIFIFLSTLIKEDLIWGEILLISGWVPIWEVIEVELFSDISGRRKRKIINRILNSNIVEKNI